VKYSINPVRRKCRLIARRASYHRLEFPSALGRSCAAGSPATDCFDVDALRSGNARASTRSPRNIEISAKIPVRDFLVSANIPTGLSCAELFYVSHWGLLGHAAGGCEWGTTHSAPSGVSLAAFDCRVSHRHLASPCRWLEWAHSFRQR